MKDYSALLEKVFYKMINATKENSNSHMNFQSWEWPTGVGIYGLFKYYKATNDKKYLDYIEKWYEERIASGLPPKNVNSVAPFLTLLHIYEIDPKPEYMDLCTEWAEWVINEMPRTLEEGLQHITIIEENRQQLWADTLFMTVLFLTKMGKLTGNQRYLEEAEYQFLEHIKALYDRETGLWFHGWNFEGRHNFGRVRWARGNSWYTSSVVEYLEISELEGAVKKYLIETLKTQVEALAKHQDKSGLWYTIIDDNSSYLEASATAGFAYGIMKAVRKGYIDKKYLEIGKKALEGVIGCIDEDGTVLQVSYGTAMGKNSQHYKDIPITPTAYGQALTMMMLTEAMQLDK